METIKAILDFICFTGLNEHVAAFAANNAIWLGPVAMLVYGWLKHRAKLTPETWDDDMIKAIGERIGLEPAEEDDEEIVLEDK